MKNYTIHDCGNHFVWDNSIAPVMTVAPGETVVFETQDASGGQISRSSTADVFSSYNSSRVNPVSGPVYIDGAEPGDILVVRLQSYEPCGWGWTANIPGFGLLADDFKEAVLHIWTYDPSGREPLLFGDFAKIPLAPFTGTIGVAPSEPGAHDIIPPRRVGGNMDIRNLVAGSVLYLPVEVPGALFSVGDTHAAQGDGEVCGTAIESTMRVSVQFDLVKQQSLNFPRIEAPAIPVFPNDVVDITTGISPDIHLAAKDAVRGMIDLLMQREGMTDVQAYMLCSVAGDLKISQIVDAPNWTVSFHLSRGVFG